MAFSTGSSAQSSEINVTPLIDVLLVLLIIFMVIVPITPRGLDSSVPQGTAAVQPAVLPVVVRVMAGKIAGSVQYRVGEQEVAYAALEPTMTQLFSQRQDRTLFVEADRNLTYQQVAVVLSEGRKAGAGQVVLNGSQR